MPVDQYVITLCSLQVLHGVKGIGDWCAGRVLQVTYQITFLICCLYLIQTLLFSVCLLYVHLIALCSFVRFDDLFHDLLLRFDDL